MTSPPDNSSPLLVPPAGLALSPARIRMLLWGLALATGMEFYTFDSMNLVLVDIGGTLGVSSDEASWLLTIYSCSLFLGVPVSIWAAGHFGYKKFLLATIILFAITAVGCSLSYSLKVMLIWRAMQGAAGAGLVVWWRASIYLLLPKADRGRSLMRVSTGLFLASAFGLLISGYVTDHYNWHLIFLPNSIMASGAVLLLWKAFPSATPKVPKRLQQTDWLGLLLLAGWTICLQIILSRGTIDDWFGSPHIRYLAWVGAVMFCGFVGWQLNPRNSYPLLDIKLLGNRNVLAAALIGTCTGMILSGSLFVLPRFLRNLDSQTHSATQTGRIICIYALTAVCLRPMATALIARIGARLTIIFGIGALVLSMALLNHWLTTGTPDGYYVLPLLLYAFCLAPLLPAVGSGTVAHVQENQLLDGVSLYMTFRQLGASLGVALLTIFIEQRETLHSSRLFEHLRRSSIRTQSTLSGTESYLAAHLGRGLTQARDATVKLLQEAGSKQAATLSYADAFLFMAFVGLIALCFVPLVAPLPQKPAAGVSSQIKLTGS